MHEPSGDLQRLDAALAEHGSCTASRATCERCRCCSRRLRKGDWKVTCAVHAGERASSGSGPA